jgi:hypothetical protein
MKTKTTINVLGKEFSIHFDPIAKQRYIAGIPSENIDDICDHFAEKLNVPSGKVMQAFLKVGFEALKAERENRMPRSLGQILTDELEQYQI